MKILYLSPLIPSLSGNGGKRAIYNHILELDKPGIKLDAIMIDVNGSKDAPPRFSENVKSKVFDRTLPKALSSNIAKITSLLVDFFNPLPRALRVINSNSARLFIEEALRRKSYDALIVDHLNGYGLVYNLDIPCPIIYIAHNIEAAVTSDHILNMKFWNPMRILLCMDKIKVKKFESKICRQATVIVPISSADAEIEPISLFRDKVTIWPELPTIKPNYWKPNKEKCLLFVGSSKYFPNREAIEWLASTLIPELRMRDINIKLNVAGTSSDEMLPQFLTEGVSYLGFVSDLELENLHLNSTLFISPVILGGGIKIKVLEATSYGIPVVATSESLRGINYLSDHVLRISRNNKVDIQAITELLSDHSKLARISRSMVSALNSARKKRIGLIEIIKNVVTDNTMLLRQKKTCARSSAG